MGLAASSERVVGHLHLSDREVPRSIRASVHGLEHDAEKAAVFFLIDFVLPDPVAGPAQPALDIDLEDGAGLLAGGADHGEADNFLGDEGLNGNSHSSNQRSATGACFAFFGTATASTRRPMRLPPQGVPGPAAMPDAQTEPIGPPAQQLPAPQIVTVTMQRLPQTLYRAQFSSIRGTKWTVKRRYSEFRELFEALSAKYEFPRSGSLFPSKFTVANALMPSHAGREQLARRRARKLELFLNEALACDVDSNLGAAGLDVQPDRIPKTQCLREFVAPPLQLQLQSWRNAQNVEMTGNMFGVLPSAGLLGSGGPRPGGGGGAGSSSAGAAWSGASTPPPTARPPMSLLEQRLEVSSPREEQLEGVVLQLEEAGDQQQVVDVGGGRGGDFRLTGLEQGPSSGSGARGAVAASSTRKNMAGEGSCSSPPTNSSPEIEEEEEVVAAAGRTGSTAKNSVAGPDKQHQHQHHLQSRSVAADYSPGAGTSCLGSVCATTLCSTPLLGNTCIQDAEEAAKRLSTRSTVVNEDVVNARSNNAVLSNKPLGFRQTLSPAHELLNSFDVQLLSYVFSFLPVHEVVKYLPLVCTAFYLAVMCTPGTGSTWEVLTYRNTLAPAEQKLRGLYRLLGHVAAKNVRKFSFEVLIGNAKLVEPLPMAHPVPRTGGAEPVHEDRKGVALLGQFLEAVADVSFLRKLALDCPFSVQILKDVHALLLLSSFGDGSTPFVLEDLRLYFRPPIDFSLSGGSGNSNLDFVLLEIPQEPLIDFLFKEPPPESTTEDERTTSSATTTTLGKKKSKFQANKKKVKEIPNKEVVFAGLSMANADTYFADEFAVSSSDDEDANPSTDGVGKAAKKPPKYYTSIRHFSLALSPDFVQTGLRREFRELGQNPAYYNNPGGGGGNGPSTSGRSSQVTPYVSPLLQTVHTFFPRLVSLEIDFVTENLLHALRDPVTSSRPRAPDGITGTTGTTGSPAPQHLQGRSSRPAAEVLKKNGGGAAAAVPYNADRGFLPHIRRFVLRGNLTKIRHVKDQVFHLLLKKLGNGLESFLFLPEAELSYLDMYKGMVFGHSYANLAEELRGRARLKRLEIDWIYFNNNALRALNDFCGAGLEVLRLNSCEHLIDESVDILRFGGGLGKGLQRLRLRASNGFTDLLLQKLVEWAGENSTLRVELEPSYFHSAFMLQQLEDALSGSRSGGEGGAAAADGGTMLDVMRAQGIGLMPSAGGRHDRGGFVSDGGIESGHEGLDGKSRLTILPDKLDAYREAKAW
eukprot:CAMPEP_0178992132 /NCGR_PEP_ID=MMETSP0795-20121207/5933_1 /TAXON_ID=88552 /ORGANISM="Amoebophrya sp., Strain Ameob2" /LENGTH=1257 /DNA_ID=CAMNT_0020683957 /DNA_START=325 /DNA_END=4096 /DNA_ORIENTATION=+